MPKSYFIISIWVVLASQWAWAARLVSTSPQITELLFQLGKAADIVATPIGSLYPAEAKLIPKLGPLYFPSVEKTIQTKSDWVLIDATLPLDRYRETLEAHKIKTLTLNLDSLESLFRESYRVLLKVYNEKHSPFLSHSKKCLLRLSKRTSKVKKRSLILSWFEPPILVGRGTFLYDLLSYLGTSDLIPPSITHPFPALSPEWFFLRKIDVVFYLTHAKEVEVEAQRFLKTTWPHQTIELVALDAKHFARASFTALERLITQFELLPEGCDEA